MACSACYAYRTRYCHRRHYRFTYCYYSIMAMAVYLIFQRCQPRRLCRCAALFIIGATVLNRFSIGVRAGVVDVVTASACSATGFLALRQQQNGRRRGGGWIRCFERLMEEDPQVCASAVQFLSTYLLNICKRSTQWYRKSQRERAHIYIYIYAA